MAMVVVVGMVWMMPMPAVIIVVVCAAWIVIHCGGRWRRSVVAFGCSKKRADGRANPLFR